jgi:2-polyprenyl-3-methyl-5-hydroxy-6-metoxy-1,4-benzoquinol methylase
MPDKTSCSEIDAILNDLQAEIRRHRVALGDLGVLDPPDPLAALRDRQRVNSHLPIGWPVMPRGIWPKLVAYAQKITRRLLRWYINPLVEQQNAYNMAVTEALTGVYRRMDELAQASGRIDGTLSDLSRRSDAAQERLAALTEVAGCVESLTAWKETAAPRLDELDLAMEPLRRHAEDTDSWLHDIEERIEQARQSLQRERETREDREETLRLRLQRLDNWRRAGSVQASAASGEEPGTNAASSIDYYLLGARYRNRVNLASRLGDYDDLFADLAHSQQAGHVETGSVLDIGAGRGEFVAHLQTLGLAAYGIDIDEDAVTAAQGAGRDVRLAEGQAHLSKLADDSLAAVIMIQVVEHLTVEELLGLWKLCWQKLSAGGLLLAETLNPTCLWSLSNWYLMDPSHKMPLHPEMARFLLEQAGFGDISVRYLHPVAEEDRLKPLPEGGAAQHNVERLNHLLYGPQDYAIVAHKVVEE